MKRKHMAGETMRFLAFAFYPMATILGCLLATGVIDVGFGIWMAHTAKPSTQYDILFAIMTGATASFIVAIVVELTGNYRRNKLAWHELQAYYAAVEDFELMKKVLMKRAPGHSFGTLTPEEASEEADETDPEDEIDQPKDLVQATWQQLPQLMPILKSTFAEKKALLTEREIYALREALFQYSLIRESVAMKLRPVFLHNTMNHPDEAWLRQLYPENIYQEMEPWIRKLLATQESNAAIDRLVDSVLSDSFLLRQYMSEYDISEGSLERDDSEQEDTVQPEENAPNPAQEEAEFLPEEEPKDEETFRRQNDAFYQRMHKEFIQPESVLISKSCKNISDEVGRLEKEIRRKPYVGLMLRWAKKNCKPDK